jgi:hypothetical protein
LALLANADANGTNGTASKSKSSDGKFGKFEQARGVCFHKMFDVWKNFHIKKDKLQVRIARSEKTHVCMMYDV